MSQEKSRATLMVLSGSFASQPLAFAALLDGAGDKAADVDLADVDVIREVPDVRLAHYFRPAIVARIQALQDKDNTLIIVRPSALQTGGLFKKEGARLRLLGHFAGEVVEARRRGDNS